MTNKKPRAVILAPYFDLNKEVTNAILTGRTSIASDKFQAKPALQALIRLGYETKAISLNTNFQIHDMNKFSHPEICLVSKLRSHPKQDKNLYAMFHQACVLNLKRKGAIIVTLYSDHLAFKDNAEGELYKNILFLSDAIVSPTSTLIVHAQKWTRSNIYTAVVRDPCLIPERPYNHLDQNEACKVLWFGNNSNIKYLRSTLPALLASSPSQRKFQFTFLATDDGLLDIRTILSNLTINPCWDFRFAEWDHSNQPHQLVNELNTAHITFIPSDPKDPRKSGVSHNRLTDSIQSGCIAIASPMDSYLELAKVSLIGNNFSELFSKAVADYNRLCDKYSSLRKDFLKPFQPEFNESSWDTAIKSIIQIKPSLDSIMHVE